MWAAVTVIASVTVPKPNAAMAALALAVALCVAVLMITAIVIITYVACIREGRNGRDNMHNMDGTHDMGQPDIILVEDSPLPTRSFVTPGRLTPRHPRSARRAGQRRVKGQRRPWTAQMDPALEGHCGYQAALAAAHQRPTLSNVFKLRKQVAQQFVQGVLQDEEEAGIQLRQLVIDEGLTLQAYRVAVETTLWASPAELSIAARILGVSYYIISKHFTIKVGNGKASSAIIHKGQHFYLAKLHRRIQQKGHPARHRAGMLSPWTDWQQEVSPQSDEPEA